MFGILVSAVILNDLLVIIVATYSNDPCTEIKGAYSARSIHIKKPICDCQRKEKKCWSEIRWEKNRGGNRPATHYRIKFQDEKCVQIPGNKSFYRFASNDPDDSWHEYTILPEPVIRSPSLNVNFFSCPEKLEITEDPHNYLNVPSDHDYVFNCPFKGIPEPDDIIWKFKASNATNNVKETLHPGRHIRITKGKKDSTLTILNALENHSGSYTCEITNFLGDSDESEAGILTVHSVPPKERRSLGPIIGGVTGALLLTSVTLVIIYIYCRKKRSETIIATDEHRVYISYCCENEKERNKLLKFSRILKEKLKGATIVIDLTHQIAINNDGGMSQWVPSEMQKADRILVILSKEYLASLQSVEKNDSTLKVQAECSYIQNIIHNNLQVSERLVLVVDDVNPEDFPKMFYGRLYIPFPGNSQIDFESQNSKKMLSLLSRSYDFHSENLNVII